MNEISKKLSQFLLEKNVASGWSCVEDTMDQGYNSAFIYDFILRDAMYRIGEMWEENKISVAHEHLATGTCELILTKYHLEKLNDRLIEENSPSPRAMFFCVEGEEHDLGLKMASSLFEEYGWDVYDLGSNLPLDYAEYSLKKWQPDVVCISLSIRHHLPKLKETIERLQNISPGTTFIVGSRLHAESAFRSCCPAETLIAKDTSFLFQWLEDYRKEAGIINKGVLL